MDPVVPSKLCEEEKEKNVKMLGKSTMESGPFGCLIVRVPIPNLPLQPGKSAVVEFIRRTQSNPSKPQLSTIDRITPELFLEKRKGHWGMVGNSAITLIGSNGSVQSRTKTHAWLSCIVKYMPNYVGVVLWIASLEKMYKEKAVFTPFLK